MKVKFLVPEIDRDRFSETLKNFENLKDKKTSFEKSNCLIEINNIMIKEAETIYESENGKKFDIQGDTLAACWTYILAKYMYENDIITNPEEEYRRAWNTLSQDNDEFRWNWSMEHHKFSGEEYTVKGEIKFPVQQ